MPKIQDGGDTRFGYLRILKNSTRAPQRHLEHGVYIAAYGNGPKHFKMSYVRDARCHRNDIRHSDWAHEDKRKIILRRC